MRKSIQNSRTSKPAQLSADTSDNRESTADFASRLNAPVAVNGGYFTMNKTPAGAGLLAIDGSD
ncbi:MAG: hypothetical protein R3C26_25440 [Calditrichia bacterium]